MRRWMAVLLCLAQLAGLCGCQAVTDALSAAVGLGQTEPVLSAVMPEMSAVMTPTPTATPQPTPQPTPTLRGTKGELVPVYSRRSDTTFREDCERLAACTDANEAIALYERLYAEALQWMSLRETAYVAYSRDVTDAYWTEESLWSENQCAELSGLLCGACCAVMKGPCAERFRAHVGAAAAEYYAQYDRYDDTADALLERESELETQYYAALSGADSLAVSVSGEEWTMERLDGADGDALYWDDYEAYWDVYDRVMEAVNGQLGPIYVELVQLRGQLAQLYGYESYSDYAYENTYGRDYGPDEAARFCQQVKQSVSRRYYDDVYYADVGTDYSFSSMNAAQLMQSLGRYAAAIDPLVGEAWDYMTENGLYTMVSGSACMSGAYTVTFPESGAPYIYQYLYGDGGDFLTLSHEFGHFTQAYVSPNPEPLILGGNYDLMEIHSNGLEVLYSRFYPEIFGAQAPQAEQALLVEMLGGVVDGCVFDEFQRRVYAQAEDITLEQVNRIYSEVCVEFGEYDEVYNDCRWMYISHNFENPLYYISYAVSALAALQIWDISREDYDRAVDVYRAVVQADAYEKGYGQVIDECGLRRFSEDGGAAAICTPVLDHLAEGW